MTKNPANVKGAGEFGNKLIAAQNDQEFVEEGEGLTMREVTVTDHGQHQFGTEKHFGQPSQDVVDDFLEDGSNERSGVEAEEVRNIDQDETNVNDLVTGQVQDADDAVVTISEEDQPSYGADSDEDRG